MVEGYTDVLMAHQVGSAPGGRHDGHGLERPHVQHLRRFVPRVVLVFDADAGGNSGRGSGAGNLCQPGRGPGDCHVARGLDPCDLLVQEGGPDRFRQVLADAVDALDFKLSQLLAGESAAGVEGRRRAVDAVLGIIALAPDMAGQAGAVKRELMVSRIAQRLALREETVWARLNELRATAADQRSRAGATGGRAPARGRTQGAGASAGTATATIALGRARPGGGRRARKFARSKSSIRACGVSWKGCMRWLRPVKRPTWTPCECVSWMCRGSRRRHWTFRKWAG